MKVVCKETSIYKLPNSRVKTRLKDYTNPPDDDDALHVGREYTVYGVVFVDNNPWYFLCSETNDLYSWPYPRELFDVLDNRLSSYWKLCTRDDGEDIQSFLVFEEWAKDSMYYERLLDGDFEDEAIFIKYKKLMDEEFS